MEQNQRSQARRKTSDYYLLYEPQNGELIGRLADISATGMKIISTEPLSRGVSLKCRLVFPEPVDDLTEITIDTECVWCRENERAGWYESGHVFKDLPEGEQAVISTLTRRILTEETETRIAANANK